MVRKKKPKFDIKKLAVIWALQSVDFKELLVLDILQIERGRGIIGKKRDALRNGFIPKEARILEDFRNVPIGKIEGYYKKLTQIPWYKLEAFRKQYRLIQTLFKEGAI